MNLLEFIHFIYKDFEFIEIKLANSTVIYDGTMTGIPLDKILFVVYHDVYWHKFLYNHGKVEVMIR